MRWQTFSVYHNEATGTDELGNIITEPKEYAEITGRFTPWTAEEIQLEERELTKNARKIITPAQRSFFNGATLIVQEAQAYEITQVKDLGKFRVLYVKEYRAWQNSDISS